MANDKILEVENLSVSFNTYAGEVKAVRGVSSVSYTHLTLPTILRV